MKFKHKDKGTLLQSFASNSLPAYREQGLSGHPGVDWTKGFGSFIPTDNSGYVYKIWQPQEREDNWAAVYILVPYGKNYMEVCLGHFSRIYAKIGPILEGQIVGREGNSGLVYSQGILITPEMQDRGDVRGSHVHEQYRPVKRVKKVTWGRHYLDNKNGRYRDREGYYYEVMHENGVNGCIDPRGFDYEDTRADKLRCLVNQALGITSLIK